MTMFIIQALLLLAIAYVLGCIFGGLMQRYFVGPEVVSEPEPAPIVPAATPEPEPKPKPKPRPKPEIIPPKETEVASAAKDDLKRIRGIGPQNETRLNEIGISAFAQIAGWSAKEQREIGERLAFAGRIEREEWVKQAKTLAKGGDTEFAKRVSSGKVQSSQGKAKPSETGKKPPMLSSAPAGGGDDLTLIDGIGNAIEKKLFAMGIHTYDQIAKWNADQQAWIGNELGFPGRPERENWVSEASSLAKGATNNRPKRVDRGEIRSSRKSKK